MGVITGIRGLVNGVSRFQDWSVTSSADLKEIQDAGTSGSARQIPGTENWNGTYNAGGIVPEFLAGDIMTFLGSIDGAVGLSGSALITQTTITIPISAGDPITHENTLYGLGQLVAGPAVVAEPDPPVAPDMPKGICVELSPVNVDTPVYVSEVNTSNIVITLTVDPAEYVDCSTNGTQNAIEGPWGGDITYERNVDDFSLLPTLGGPYYARVPTKENSVATEWWEFDFVRVGEHSNQQVNRDGTIVNASVPLIYSNVEEVGLTTPTETRGEIRIPGSTVWKPQAMQLMQGQFIQPSKLAVPMEAEYMEAPEGEAAPARGRVWRPEPPAVAFARRINGIQLTVDAIEATLKDAPPEQVAILKERMSIEIKRIDDLLGAIDGFNKANPQKQIQVNYV